MLQCHIFVSDLSYNLICLSQRKLIPSDGVCVTGRRIDGECECECECEIELSLLLMSGKERGRLILMDLERVAEPTFSGGLQGSRSKL